MLHSSMPAEIEQIRESKRGCSRVIVKHRSQSGKRWSSNLRNGLVDNVLTFPAHGSYTVIRESVARSRSLCDRESILDGRQPIMKASKLSARILYPALSILHFESLSLVPEIPSKSRP